MEGTRFNFQTPFFILEMFPVFELLLFNRKKGETPLYEHIDLLDLNQTSLNKRCLLKLTKYLLIW